MPLKYVLKSFVDNILVQKYYPLYLISCTIYNICTKYSLLKKKKCDFNESCYNLN